MFQVASSYCWGSEGFYRVYQESENSFYCGWEFDPESESNYHVEHFDSLKDALLYMDNKCQR